MLSPAGLVRRWDLPSAFPCGGSCLRSNIYLRRRLALRAGSVNTGELAEQDAQPVCSLQRRRRIWKSSVTGCFSSCFKYARRWWSHGIWGAGSILGVPPPQLRCGVHARSTEVEVRAAGWRGRLQDGIQAGAPRGQRSLPSTLQLLPGRKQPLACESPNLSPPA